MKINTAVFIVAVLLQSCATALLAAPPVVVSPPVEEAKPTLTCWYNENGASTGADSGEFAGGVRGEVLRLMETGDYAWAYIIDGEDGGSCPDTLPGMVAEEASPVEEEPEPLTCWYDDKGASTGADAGNQTGGAVGEPMRVDPSWGAAWAYVITEWQDGGSCPDTLPGMVAEEASPVEVPAVEEAKPPLTCWYNDKKASTGADIGNYSGRALGKAVRLSEAGENAWAYVISDWEDGSSCPDKLPGVGSYN